MPKCVCVTEHLPFGSCLWFIYFSVVIQTYRRVKSLLLLIKDLNDMSNLDKVLIIWNDPVKPPDDLKWPTIHVPVQVLEFCVKMDRHSKPAIK